MGFVPQTLSDVWIQQDFRIGSTTATIQTAKGESRGQPSYSLEQAVASGGNRIIVEGPAGSGKSTQLRKFIVDRITKILNLDDFDHLVEEPVPVYVNASDLFEEKIDLATSLETAVRSSLGLRLPFPIPSGFFDRRQAGAAKHILLVIDGINEIEISKRDHLISVLGLESETARDITVIFGSWPLERSNGDLWRGFFRVEVSEFDETQATSLVEKLLGKKVAKKFLSHQSRLPRSPMLLTLAALLQSEQTILSRATLYREFILASLKKRSQVGLLPENPVGMLRLLSSCADQDMIIDVDVIADLACDQNLISSDVLGLARRQSTESLLIATGVIVKRSDRLELIHYSFRSYLRAEHLAELHGPDDRDVWNQVSPFREDWDTVNFVCEIWVQKQRNVAAALGDLLAFGEPGLRAISALAARLPNLPSSVIRAAIDKWMYREDEFWDPGYINGPVQQIALIASNYDDGKIALRTIASDSGIYSEDSVYAAKGLADVGLELEAKDRLIKECRDTEIYCMNRILAAEILLQIGFFEDARICLIELQSEWEKMPPDMSMAEISLAAALYRVGRKRTGLSLLKRLSEKLVDEFDWELLAGAYADLGYPKQARKFARKVFDAMKWSFDLDRGYRSEALRLLDLLDRIEMEREASLVRKGVARTADYDTDVLQRTAFDTRERVDRRLAAAEELLNRGRDQPALQAFESVASDLRIATHERFSSIPLMLSINGGRARAVSLLRRTVEEEPSQRIACGKMLVLSGELEVGWSLLSRVALEPAEATEKRVHAICELSKLGRLDIAAAGFRKLCVSGAATAAGLSSLAETFAHTSFWKEFLYFCNKLVIGGRAASAQIRAVEILNRSAASNQKAGHMELLRKLVLNRGALVEDRIDAARALSEYWGDMEVDLLFDIAAAPEETMEAGLAAMDTLYSLGSHFPALDAGYDVVWDKKLTKDQFIEAAHRFLRNCVRLEVDEELDLAIVEKLVSIASDVTEPFERRLAAARIDITETPKKLRGAPFWPAVIALIDDELTPLSVRWPAIFFAVEHNPSLLEKFRLVLLGDSLPPLHVAEIFRAGNDLEVAAEYYNKVLLNGRNMGVRLDVLSRLSTFNKVEFDGRKVAEDLNEMFRSKDKEAVDASMLTKALILAERYLDKEAYLDLARTLAESARIAPYEIRPILDVIAGMSGDTEIQRILSELLSRDSPTITKDFYAFYRTLQLQNLRAAFGEREGATADLIGLSRLRKLSINQRAHACRWLAHINGREAKKCLRNVLTEAKNSEEVVDLAEIAVGLHDWNWARLQFLSVAQDKSARLSARIDAAKGLGRVGFYEAGQRILSELDLKDVDVISSAIAALISCKREEKAFELCRDFLVRPDVDLLDRLEAVASMGRLYRKDLARSLLVEALEREKFELPERSRAAELLNELGYQSEARTILFDLQKEVTQSKLHFDEGLWLIDAMMSCGLYCSARFVFDRIDRRNLSDDSLDRYEEIRTELDEPFLVE